MEKLQLNQVIHLKGDIAPVVATAIHDGHFIREALVQQSGLSEDERLREEDPFTAQLIEPFPTTIVGLRSRFELDLNRSPDKAVYLSPDDAWGLNVWKEPLTDEQLKESRAMYELAFNEIQPFFQACIDHYGSVIVLDCHSYNHMRDGADQPPADPEGNPEINLGTKNMNREHWAPVIDMLLRTFSSHAIMGKNVDVRENIKFKGGYFSEWLYQQFGDAVCSVAIEFKKTFMDEWTGVLYEQHHRELSDLLLGTLPILTALQQELITRK